MRKLLLLISLGFSITSLAQLVPESAFYGGLGISGVSTNFGNEDVSTLGISNVYKDGVLVNSGSAGGPYNLETSVQYSLSPSAQLGYFQHFKESDWLWGAKFTYSYLTPSYSTSRVAIPQYGTNTTGDAFTGTAIVQSFQTSLNHQMTLTPYIGRSFKNIFFYVGAGPSLSQTNTQVNGVTGYANIDGLPVNISGQPQNFSNNSWVYGFSAVAGGTYFLSPTLFLDLSYTYNQTKNHTDNFSAPFTNVQGPYTTTGSLIGSTTASVATQAVTLTINKAF